MISVCITTYNGEKYIKEQLASILSQLSSEDEVILSDDNSSDNTIDIVKSMNSQKIQIFKNVDASSGYTSNFENAIKHAKGDYIFLSDQDDVWKPDKVTKMKQALQISDFVVSDASVVDSELKPIYTSFFSSRKPFKSLLGNILKFGYLGCCFAFRKNILNKALPFPDNHKKCTHDNWLFLIAKAFYKVTILEDKLIYYRRHEDNTSDGGIINHTSLFFKVSYRLYLIKKLIQRIRF